MAYKVPGVTVKNQFEPLVNPGAFGNRLLAVVGEVDTSISSLPTFVIELQKGPYATYSFKRPNPYLGTIDSSNRVVKIYQGTTTYEGYAATDVYITELERSTGSTDTVSFAETPSSTTFIYLRDQDGKDTTGDYDSPSVSFSSGTLTVDWSGAVNQPAAGTKYMIVFGNDGPDSYNYYSYSYAAPGEEDVTVYIVWTDTVVNSISEPLENSIYYMQIRREMPSEATVYTNVDQVYKDFGSILSPDNTTIQSELSLAAYLVFGEGAPAVMLVPYDSTTKSMDDAYSELLTTDRPTIITALDDSDPASPSASIRKLIDHVRDASSDTYKKYRIGLIGPYYTSDYINKYTAAAQAVHDRRISIVAPPNIKFLLTGTDGLTREYTVTAKFASVILGAMMTRTEYDVATSMTRKASRTITDLDPTWDDATMNLIAQAGVTIFTLLRGNIIVRDDITTEPETIMTAEPYITTIADDIASSAITVLDQALIGQKLILPTTLIAINGRLTSMLSGKQSSGIITAYRKPIIEIDPNDPRKVNVTIPVQPVFATKFIDITFSYVASL